MRNEKELLQLINAHFSPEAVEIQREQNLSVKLKKEEFHRIHYMSMAVYKMMIFIFCLVPWIVLMILG